MNCSQKGNRMQQICVWGASVTALSFSIQCKNTEIVAYIDSNKTQEEFLGTGIKIYKPEDALVILKSYFIVIATSDNAFWEIKKKLEDIGLIEFKHFCFHAVFNKKIAILYGNCHMSVVKDRLKNNCEFTKIYGIYPLRLIHEIYTSGLSDLSNSVFEYCDLFIHQDIQHGNRYGEKYASENVIGRLHSTCKIIAVPNVYGLPKYMFPQIDCTFCQKTILSHNFYSFRDVIIEKLYQDGKSVDYIVNSIKYENVFPEKNVIFQYDLFKEKLLRRQKNWDIDIIEFYKKNCRIKHLFYDINHPTGVLLEYIANKVLEIIGINPLDDKYCSNIILDTYEVPIYGCVMDIMGMTWENDYILKKSSKYTYSGTCLNLKNYVEQYLKWHYLYK